jgi:hypothetical protein
MKVIKSKAIIFCIDEPGQKVEFAQVNERWLDNNIKLNKFQLIKAILFEKGFLWKLGCTIKYALLHSESYMGEYSADVLLLEYSKSFENIWQKKLLTKDSP